MQLKRRADLVPQLVEAVRGYAAHEKALLTTVTELRGSALAAKPGAAGRFDAEKQLGAKLQNLVLLQEAYPQLKADANFRDLSAKLVEVEDHLQYARRFYNGAVKQYATRLETFPARPRGARLRLRAAAVLRDRRPRGGEGAAVRIAFALRCCSPRCRRRAQERILSFHSDIRSRANGELIVTETIEAQVEQRRSSAASCAISRPTTATASGARVTVPFEVVSVRRNGARRALVASAPYANGVSVRIGNANVMLPRGRHVYEITYRTRCQVGFFEQHDELYWNVNGNGWTFAMDDISADVQLAGARCRRASSRSRPIPARSARRAATTRPQARDGGASFRTTRALGPREGLTIVVMFPKGVVRAPTFARARARWLDDNLGEAVGAAGLLVLLLAFLYWRWHLVGRDPRAGPAVPALRGAAGDGARRRALHRPHGVRRPLLRRGAARPRARAATCTSRTPAASTSWSAPARTWTGCRASGAGGPAAPARASPPPSARRTTRRCRSRWRRTSASSSARYEEKLFSRNRGSHVVGVADRHRHGGGDDDAGGARVRHRRGRGADAGGAGGVRATAAGLHAWRAASCRTRSRACASTSRWRRRTTSRA